MNVNDLKNIVKVAINEAKEAKKAKNDKKTKPKAPAKKTDDKKPAKKSEGGGTPKSSGKLVDLKKEKEALKQMKEAIAKFTSVNEGEAESPKPTAAFSHMQRYINEIDKINELTSNLSSTLDENIKTIDEKIVSETAKIKEMIGLTPPVEEKKTTPTTPKAENKED